MPTYIVTEAQMAAADALHAALHALNGTGDRSLEWDNAPEATLSDKAHGALPYSLVTIALKRTLRHLFGEADGARVYEESLSNAENITYCARVLGLLPDSADGGFNTGAAVMARLDARRA